MYIIRCKNEILENELLSKIIYKPPCSPCADLCCSMSSLVSGCNLVASIVSFICSIHNTNKRNYLRFGRQVHKVAQFYRKRLQEVSERSKRPRTQSLQVVIA